MIYHFGLTGFPITYSLSPCIHQAAFKSCGLAGDYKLFPLKSGASFERLLLLLRQGDLHGLNVTIPHKQTVCRLVDQLSPTARMSGAVNTIFMRGDKMTGENTDVVGFLTDLHEKIGSKIENKNVLILGAGGAARAAAIGLLSVGWQVSVSARNPEQTQKLAADLSPWARPGYLWTLPLEEQALSAQIGAFSLLVNATSAGMYPNVFADPLPAAIPIPPGLIFYDFVYNPMATALMRRFRQAGNAAHNGLGMLIEQGSLAFELWTGVRVPRKPLWDAVEEH
jgi:shikimate dehydrogenase